LQGSFTKIELIVKTAIALVFLTIAITLAIKIQGEKIYKINLGDKNDFHFIFRLCMTVTHNENIN